MADAFSNCWIGRSRHSRSRRPWRPAWASLGSTPLGDGDKRHSNGLWMSLAQATTRLTIPWASPGRHAGTGQPVPYESLLTVRLYLRLPGQRPDATGQRRNLPMTPRQLRFSESELLSDHDFTTPHRIGDQRLHGGFDADGTYIPPRSKGRRKALDNWSAELRERGRRSARGRFVAAYRAARAQLRPAVPVDRERRHAPVLERAHHHRQDRGSGAHDRPDALAGPAESDRRGHRRHVNRAHWAKACSRPTASTRVANRKRASAATT